MTDDEREEQAREWLSLTKWREDQWNPGIITFGGQAGTFLLRRLDEARAEIARLHDMTNLRPTYKESEHEL